MFEAGITWGFHGIGRWAHGGMLRAAIKIREEIEESNVLSRIYDESLTGSRNVGPSGPLINQVRIPNIAY